MRFEDGFEGAFVYYNGVSELEVPEGWVPMWIKGTEPGVNHRPEYKPERERMHGGQQAAMMYTRHASHDGVLCKRLPVAAGLLVQLEAWGATFKFRAGQALQVGIDPTGGLEFPSERIVWGEWWGQYSPDWQAETFQRFEVMALAERAAVTVFLRSKSDYAGDVVAAYWDDVQVVQEGDEPSPGPDEGLRRVFDEFLEELGAVVQRTKEKL